MKESMLFRARGSRSEPWILAGMAVAVGAVSSIVAVSLRGGVHALFEALARYRDAWWAPLLPAAGALLGVWIVRLVFREPAGHGVSAVLEAVSSRGGAMRPRSVFSRLLGSMVNVASGGSAGLEGPTVFSSAAVGSVLATLARVGERQRILLLACGVAGGIGAIFNAPLTGMIFALEVVLAEWTLGAVLPIAISATVATEIGRQVFGRSGAFVLEGGVAWHSADLAACAVLGAGAGLLSVAMVGLIVGIELAGRRLRATRLFGWPGALAMLGGLAVGAIGIAQPHAIGEGYTAVNIALSGGLSDGLLALAVLGAAKTLATSLTLGSGAPGGIFAPSLVLGATLGTLFGAALHALMPAAGFAPPSFFALAAMAGFVSGTMHAPFTGILLALETTEGWHGTLPLILVAVLSTLVSRTLLRHSFYTWELEERGTLLRPGTDRRILADLKASELLDEGVIRIEAGRTLEDLARLLPSTARSHFGVVDAQGRLLGMVDVASLRGVIFDEVLRRITPVDTVMDTAMPRIGAGESAMKAMERFEACGAWVLPVVDAQGRLLGTISKGTLFDRYRSELILQTAEKSA
jgi:CIC family chloride channel protein